MKETLTRTINLPEEEPEILKLLIQYLYEGEYEPLLYSADAQTLVERELDPWRVQKYHFSFPHTCEHQREECYRVNICPHHCCGNECRYTCRGFTCETCIGRSSQLLTHTKMYEVANKYGVVGLKELAKKKFSKSCKYFWNTSNFPIAACHIF